MQRDGVLVRFGEIGIKSMPVRRRMLSRLKQNLFDGMVRDGVEGDVQSLGARLWMVGPDLPGLLRVAQHTFGVVSASPCVKCAPDLTEMGSIASEMAMESTWSSFAVRAHRDGEHPFSSPDMGRSIGAAIWTAAEAAGRTPKVDLSNPDLAVHVEARNDIAYVYTETIRGPGGLPTGVQGKALCLVSDPASFVAAWLMMRRGAAPVLVHAGSSGSLPAENLDALRRWGGPTKADLLPICTGFVSKATFIAAAAELARRTGADAIVSGDTLDSDLAPAPGETPILRPVCGLSPPVVEDLVGKIGLDADEPEHIFDDGSHETVETTLSMHRITEW